MKFKDTIESGQLMFLPAVTSLLSICEQNVLVKNKRREQHDPTELNRKPQNISEQEKWLDTYFYHHEYEHLLYHSIFISLYSLLESHLASIARLLESTENKKIKIKDLNGAGIIDKYRRFLFLIFEIEKADKELEIWKEFEKFQFLRNRIVHNESYLSNIIGDFPSTIGFQLLKKYPKCVVSEEGLFKITDYKFVEDFGSLIIELSQNINKEILK